MTAPVLSCRGVVHDYDGTPALHGVDLDVLEGEVLAVTGPSGSGKSTLLLCLAGILVPREGSVHLGGVDLRAVGEQHRAVLRRESVGIVFQYGTLVRSSPARRTSRCLCCSRASAGPRHSARLASGSSAWASRRSPGPRPRG